MPGRVPSRVCRLSVALGPRPGCLLNNLPEPSLLPRLRPTLITRLTWLTWLTWLSGVLATPRRLAALLTGRVLLGWVRSTGLRPQRLVLPTRRPLTRLLRTPHLPRLRLTRLGLAR
ncbi:hypothetical protein ACWGID_33850 [Kribbella sp. NPDC054772]